MKRVNCFELYPSLLDAEQVNKLLLELFPLMHTTLNNDGGIDMYITHEEYVFVLNELSKLHNYALTIPDNIEDISVTLTAVPIEFTIVERYGVLYDLMFEAEYVMKEVDAHVVVSDREACNAHSDYIIGKKFSQRYDVDEEYQSYLYKQSEA